MSSLKLACSYLRLSREDEISEGSLKGAAGKEESKSIQNQRLIIENYCKQKGITLVKEFVDDGWSGGNFERPGFQAMLRYLEREKVSIVLTKDLSRLGRDMMDSSFYADRYFPEHGIHYIAVNDNFDSEVSNLMAPFQFAMNDVYLRDISRKVSDVLETKRENGQYCACPPYGYRKSGTNRDKLIPDEMTAPVVQRIFARAAAGDSSRQIALDLNKDGVIPPLKYRVLYRDQFSPEGAARASDNWNYTTVKRILKNQVYLGHTLLGKSRKVSVKSKKKKAIPREHWAVTYDTHPPLVTQELFERANFNLGRGSRDYRAHPQVRKSIFSGIAVCAKCGHALCSCGTVYKGEREKYWYLSCTHQRQDIENTCEGVRIRYADLAELVRQDLNQLLSMSEEELVALAREIMEQQDDEEILKSQQLKREQAEARIATIDKIVAKLYVDNAEGKLADDRLERMVAELEREYSGLQAVLAKSDPSPKSENVEENFAQFYALAQSVTHIETLDRETLLTFVERIEVGPKELSPGTEKVTHRNMPYRQSVRIFYKFIGDLSAPAVRDLPAAVNQ